MHLMSINKEMALKAKAFKAISNDIMENLFP